ncbi:MAG: succinate dehydrogenase, cytochrome b556 subunit [Pseudomonadales bacterium]|nr:succinate dehydrogenase, cytochrome b556 subunit [Pseudomonadales bacterium]
MDNKRPVYLDLNPVNMPLTAITSFLHRTSGIVLFVGSAILLCLLSCSLDSQQGFDDTMVLLQGTLAKLVLWGVVSALIYHLVAGVRHLLMDMGIGEDLETALLGSKLILAVSAVLIVLAGVWIW